MNLLISLIANLKCLRLGLLCCQLPRPQHLEEGLASRKEAPPGGLEDCESFTLEREGGRYTCVSRVAASLEASGTPQEAQVWQGSAPPSHSVWFI